MEYPACGFLFGGVAHFPGPNAAHTQPTSKVAVDSRGHHRKKKKTQNVRGGFGEPAGHENPMTKIPPKTMYRAMGPEADYRSL